MALTLNEGTYTAKAPGLDRRFEFAYHPTFLPALALLGRLAFGFYFLWSGLDKLINGFTAEGFLVNATVGPLQGLFSGWGADPTAVAVIDPLVVYGQILIGFALVLGVFTRLALLMAGAQMLLFYAAALWPEHNPFLDEHIFYIGAFAVLGALGAGRILGLDALIEKTPFVRSHAWTRWLLG